MAEKSVIDWIALVLVIIGGLNWGFAVFNFNLVETLFKTGIIADIIYALVGLSAVWMIFYAAKN
ncbi:MAG TPA: DUF378 domain-containing protein [Candidatus Nanoarchaeia archaeon]|nr:DUF378 domain-containing protein [Candidatus Nanoarchaeia archaeon]